jgi:hypothetical protein
MRSITETKDPQKLIEFAKAKAQRRLLQYSSVETLADTVSILYRVAGLSDKQMPIKAYFDVVRQIQSTEQRPLCFEDEFVLALAFIELEVAKLGAVIYLKGESPDYRDTKKGRTLLDTSDDNVLKTLSSALARPNADRGEVEMGMIESAVRRMAKLIDLHNAMPEAARVLKNGGTKQDVLSEVKVGIRREKLTQTDYDIIMRMARRENRVDHRAREKDPQNSYELRADNHQRILEMATKLGVTPRRCLNTVLADFFAMLDRQSLAVQPGSKKVG